MPAKLSAESATRPLPALLSQVLVAFTVELDNALELRMGEAGFAGARLSLTVWLNLMRFLVADGVTVRDVASRALAPPERLKHELGCLERWGFIVLRARPGGTARVSSQPRLERERRAGWGSGRGIRGEWEIQLTGKGRQAVELWPPLVEEVEQRWAGRFGETVSEARRTLEEMTGRFELALPQGLPMPWLDDVRVSYPAGAPQAATGWPLPTLLSRALLMFALEFNAEADAPLSMSANTLRVLGATPTPAAQVARLTGCSPETAGLGWQHKPYVTAGPDPSGKRGRVLCLTARGLKAQGEYHRRTRDIEERWRRRFGAVNVRRLRQLLQEVLTRRREGRLVIGEALAPPAGVARAGHQTPSLGRREMGPAARQRLRDLVAQTEAFVADPEGSLPHYPLWDMNRGFGP